MASSHSTRPLTLLDLPNEILLEIFKSIAAPALDILESPRAIRRTHRPNDAHLKTIQATRLVCRRLCHLASPLLVPVLDVQINPQSIDSAEHLVQNAQIARGVRLVRISLSCRPADVANSMIRYRDIQEMVAQRLFEHCRNIARSEKDTDISRAYSAASEQWWELNTAWSSGYENDWPSHLNKPLRVGWKSYHDLTGDEVDVFWSNWLLLEDGWAKYREKQQEQQALFEDGLLANRLAALFCRIPSFPALALIDRPDFPLDEYFNSPGQTCPGGVDVTRLANDSALHQLMTSSHTWPWLSELNPPTEPLASPQLYWTLPTSIHEMGGRIDGLFLGPLAIENDFEGLHHHVGENPDIVAWKDLETAFRATRSVVVDFENCEQDYHPDGQDRVALEKYLGVLLSNPQLEHVDLDFESFIHNYRRDWDFDPSPAFIRLGSVFSAACFVNIKSIRISFVTFTEGQLGNFFCQLASCSRLDSMSLEWVAVAKGGRWARPLDILRASYAKLRLEGRNPDILFVGLSGGGFNNLLYSESCGEGDVWWIRYDKNRVPVYEAAGKFVLGRDEINPLIALESAEQFARAKEEFYGAEDSEAELESEDDQAEYAEADAPEAGSVSEDSDPEASDPDDPESEFQAGYRLYMECLIGGHPV
ncbi:hypothetical protein QBC47DRAFT_386787 [Echria macrotheca]|uniref:Uncharacterized protein n=1 Tax=Echria macrotheca TaxID=438768 RepID=A0AAJ0B8E6_9PEZI|nr:hypothetical protein QBC47DRAFT_386787 [Echria macrotheca]